jgi:hypothetical protein
MTAIARHSLVLFLIGGMLFAERAVAQTEQLRPPSEDDVLDYLENTVAANIPRRVKLGPDDMEQLRFRIFQAPAASIPILRKIVLDGRLRASRANHVAGVSASVLSGVAHVLTRDASRGWFVPAAEGLSPVPAPAPGECAILDVMGTVTRARNLTVAYSVAGPGATRQVERPTLRFALKAHTGHVVSDDSLAIPFGRIARLAHGSFEGDDIWSIVLGDGTQVTLRRHRLEQLASGGNPISRRELESYTAQAGEAQGEPLALSGYRGETRLSARRRGRLEVSDDRVALIECTAGR